VVAELVLIEKLLNGKLTALLIETGKRSTISKEARELDLNKRIEKFITREAIVIDSFPTRISAMFYYRMHEPAFPVKVFSEVDQALNWLKKQ